VQRPYRSPPGWLFALLFNLSKDLEGHAMRGLHENASLQRFNRGCLCGNKSVEKDTAGGHARLRIEKSAGPIAIPKVIEAGQTQCYPGKTFGHRAKHVAKVMGAKIDSAERNQHDQRQRHSNRKYS
jgi:hypothetical protein